MNMYPPINNNNMNFNTSPTLNNNFNNNNNVGFPGEKKPFDDLDDMFGVTSTTTTSTNNQ